MVVDRDVTWDVPTRRMHEPTTEDPAVAAPPAFGAGAALKIFLAFLGVQVVAAVVAAAFAVVESLRAGGAGAPGGIRVDLGLAIGAAFVGTVAAVAVALVLVRRAFAQPGGAAVRAAVGWARAARRDVVLGALTGLALCTALLVLGAVVPMRPSGLGPLARAAAAGGLARLVWATLAVVVAPPTEELLFRGVLYAGLARSWGRAAAAVCTTAVFVALHATEIGGYWPGWLVIAALGALALRARVAAGSLVPAIALHASYNLGLVLVAYAR
jgi:membrane protease YdiL (CAAX protease family)